MGHDFAQHSISILQILYCDVFYRRPRRPFLRHQSAFCSLQRLPCKSRQDKARLVNLLIVISTQLVLLLSIPAPQRRFDVSILVFAAHHEADLAGGIGEDGGIGILDSWEDFLAGFLEVGDEGEMEPLIFRCSNH